MFKIYLAVAHKPLEDFLIKNKLLIEKKIKDDVDFVGTAVYREGIIQGIKDYHPDVVIIREGIPGSLSLPDLVYQIKIISPTTRIIFIAGDRKPGDAFLATLVQYGVYDILIGTKVNVRDIVKKIVIPNKMADVIELMPKIKLTTDGKQLFEAPDIGLLKPVLEEEAEKNITLKPLEDISDIEDIEPIEDSNQTKEDEPPIIEESIKEEHLIETPKPIEVPINKDVKEDNLDEEIKPIKHEKKGLFGGKKKKEIQLNIEKPIETPIETPPVEPLVKPIEVPPVEEVPHIEETSIPNQNLKQEEVLPPEPEQKEFIQPKMDFSNPQENIEMESKEINPQTNIYGPQLNNYNSQPNYFGNQSFGYGNMFAPRVNTQQETQTQKKGFFGKKNNQKTISQQIITFVGGRHGCGNSQVSFNIALSLAEQGFKTLYIDLNEDFASIESILEFGFEDLGVDTMLKDISVGNFTNIVTAINSSTKALQGLEKRDSAYRFYSKLSPNLELASFSMDILNKKKEKDYDVNLLKELNMFLLMNLNYDMIILDAPSDFNNEITKIAMIYSNRVFFTLTQDITDLNSFFQNLKNSKLSKVGYKDKSNFICNKYVSQGDMDLGSIQNQIINYLLFDNFSLISIPNVYLDIINASNSSVPLLWKTKDKNFKKGIQEIISIILN